MVDFHCVLVGIMNRVAFLKLLILCCQLVSFNYLLFDLIHNVYRGVK